MGLEICGSSLIEEHGNREEREIAGIEGESGTSYGTPTVCGLGGATFHQSALALHGAEKSRGVTHSRICTADW